MQQQQLWKQQWASWKKSLPDQMKNRKHRQTTKTTALEALSKNRPPAEEAKKEPLLQKPETKRQLACLQELEHLH